jgi:Ca2+/Na+ antiporter
LFVVTIVTGVLAVKFQPTVSVKRIGRDAGGYFFAIAAVGLIVYLFGSISLLHSGILLGLYVLYVLYVAFSERQDAVEARKMNKDKRGTLASQGNEMFEVDVEDSIAVASTEGMPLMGDGGSTSPIPTWECPHDGSWEMTYYRLRAVLLRTCEDDWEDKSNTTKAIVFVQAPLHALLLLTTPWMQFGDPMLTWDRNHHVLTTFFMCPFFTLIFVSDAFYASEVITLPPLLLACIIGAVLAFFVRMTTSVQDPPRFQWLFSLVGFVIALTWIYAISDEIVAVLRTSGIMMAISPALIGMTVLGIGNGMCDLVANYLMARAG